MNYAIIVVELGECRVQKAKGNATKQFHLIRLPSPCLDNNFKSDQAPLTQMLKYGVHSVGAVYPHNLMSTSFNDDDKNKRKKKLDEKKWS